MTIDFKEFLFIDLIIALLTLVIIFIIVGIKLIKTLSKFDKTLDVIEDKLTKTDGVFNIVEKTGSFANEISDKAVLLASNLISKFIKRKKGIDEDE
ncbi:MAG: hypothetical protein IJ094_08780 [Bacilli bacterium]|nr:hypothetical protein [Bacilli bacterium]